ncbi:cAMP-dependent protein kinase regulatory subunit BCY1 [Sugiyamaella lignohabitans]|uniref:cAMP-dependent protein kinase regulatory subunit n=1 Tax=Sugiyamaella lignohabitans TaxID=796027 RepID=A0A167FU97_9ASCO|nr:cAMP-dependent protein kinase regulatory subunit BCY1 [Sugiyamaella lignohabitans]ANB15711.1 cAMP-dependent protein kinase regulatory subunit BCY1 [Sugiyamaella lignohabitans]
MSLPKEYVEELNILNREVAQNKPTDVLQFCANHFNSRLEEHRKQLLSGSSSAGTSAARSVGSPGGPTSAPSPPTGAGFGGFNTHSFSSGDPTSLAPSHGHSDDPASSDDPMTGVTPSTNRDNNTAPAFGSGSAGERTGSPGPTSGNAPFGSSRLVLGGTGVPAFASNFNANRRTSVSAESLNPHSFVGSAAPPIPEKMLSPEQLKRLNDSVSKNFLFSNLDEDSLHLLLHALEEKKVAAGTTIIQQGDQGDFYYIVESGSVDFYRDHEKISSSGSGSSFGELALMYNAPRAATVVAATDSVLWALDRITFKKILLDKTTKKRKLYGEFLKEVPVLKVLSPYELSKLADALVTKVYEPGSVVIREGDKGDEFYLIESGTATVSKANEGTVSELKKGDYFGEVALLHDSPRQATVTATTKLKVASLGRSGFQRLLGPVVDILKRQDPTHAPVAASVAPNSTANQSAGVSQAVA